MDLALLGVAAAWGSTFVVAKDAFGEFMPLSFTLTRFGLMTLLALAVLRLIGLDLRFERHHLGRLCLAALLGYTGYQLGFVLGVDHTSAFASAILIALAPLFSALLLAALRVETIARRGWAGVAISFAGTAVFVAATNPGNLLQGAGLGDLLSLGAALCFGGYSVAIRPLTQLYPSPKLTALTLGLGTVFLTPICLPQLLEQHWSLVGAHAWLEMAYMVIFPVYLAYTIWSWAIRQRGVARTTIFGYLAPVFGGVFAAIFLHEGFGPLKLVGAALVLVGLALARQQK